MSFSAKLDRARLPFRVCTNAVLLPISLIAIPAWTLTFRHVERGLLAVVLLNISWQIQKHFFLREDAAALGCLGGLQISLTNLGLAALYIGWFIKLATGADSRLTRKKSLRHVMLPGGLFLFFCAASLFVAVDRTLGVFEVCSVLERFLLYLYIVENLRSREDVLFVIRILMIGLLIQSCLMLAQAGGLLGTFDLYGLKARSEFAGDTRVSGTLGSPNPAAAYLAMSMGLAVSVLFSSIRSSEKCWSGACLVLAAVPLVFTFSRGGWLSVLIAFATLLIAVRTRPRHKAIVVIAALLILLGSYSAGPIHERLFGDDRGSVASRMPLNTLALAIIQDHPLLGVGANNFSLAMQPYAAHGFSGEFLYTVHNTYLLVWAEAGVGGLIAFVWFLIATLALAVKVRQWGDGLLAPLALGCAASILGFMVQMNFDPFRGGPASHLLWLFAGLIAVLHRLSVRIA